MAGFLVDFMNAVGYGICHQMPSRTLRYGGRGLPVCARDTGFFVAFTACLLLLVVCYRARPVRYPAPWKTAVLAAFLLPTAVDAVTSYAGLRASGNALRLATGALAGTGAAALLFPVAWGCVAALREGDREEEVRMFGPAWSLPALLLVPAAVSLSMWPSPWGYWIWAPAVTLAILLTLFALNFTLVALLFEWWKGSGSRHAPAWCVCAGAGLTVLELLASNRLHWLVERAL